MGSFVLMLRPACGVSILFFGHSVFWQPLVYECHGTTGLRTTGLHRIGLPGVTVGYRDLLKRDAGLPHRRRKWWSWELQVDPGCMTGRVPTAGRGFQWIFGAAAEKSARAAWKPHDLTSRTWSSSFVREYTRWRWGEAACYGWPPARGTLECCSHKLCH